MLNTVYFYFLCSYTLSGAQLIFYLWIFFHVVTTDMGHPSYCSHQVSLHGSLGVGVGNYLKVGKERSDSSLAGDEA